MGKGLKKNGFVEGALIAYVSIVITKILGAFYSIPFYGIVGAAGGVIYSCAYSVYTLFLNVSTSGIPTAISIIVSEYHSLGYGNSKKRAYALGLRLVTAFSLTAFLILQLFAGQIGRFFLEDMKDGVSVEAIAAAIRVMSLCLLIVPFLSAKRGYLQGHKFISVSSFSQLIEQVVRIAAVLVGAYTVIQVLHGSVPLGVCVALLGTAIGAAAALLYLVKKSRQSRQLFHTESAESEPNISNREILRKIFSYGLTVVIVAVSLNVYDIVDMKMVLYGLHRLGYSDMDTQTIASIIATWIPKICTIIVALAMGLTNSIVPHIAGSYAKGELKQVNRRINQAMSTILVVSVPLAVGLMLFSEPVYRVFYGPSAYGGNILRLAVIVNVIASMTTVAGMAMQSMGRGRMVCAANIFGMVVNGALDLPLLFLFQSIGWPAYLGTTVASIIGQSITVGLLLVSMKRSMQFQYRSVWVLFAKIIIPTACMATVALLMNRVLPSADGRDLWLVARLGLCALAGGGVYLGLTAKFHILSDALGNDIFEKLKRKLGRKV